MKRVVIEENSETVLLKDCTNEYIYLARDKCDKLNWGIITARAYKRKYRLVELNSGFTYGNGYGNDDGYHTILSAILAYIDDWDFYQFPTFRAAMEFYLEQTKENK